MRLIARLVIFAAAVLFGLTAWYALAGAQGQPSQNSASNSNTSGNMNSTAVSNMNSVLPSDMMQMNRGGHADASAHEVEATPDDSFAAEEKAAPSVKWAEPQPVSGYANAQRVKLRSEPGPSAPVVAKLEVNEYGAVEILESTRGYLRVRFPANEEEGPTARAHAYEGWVAWGVVLPHVTAIVLDAESGEVVGRLPLGEVASSVSYSPDGKRALFYNSNIYTGADGDSAGTANEVETDDYRIIRALRVDSGFGFASVLYADSGERLHALGESLVEGRDTVSRLHSFTVDGDTVEAGRAPARHFRSGAFAVSPDGLTGIVTRGAGAREDSTRMDVIDLKTMEVRHSVEVEDTGGGWWPNEYAVSWDGSKFYYRESVGVNDEIVTIDTRSGKRVGATPLTRAENRGVSFSQESLVGDSLLIRSWVMDDTEGSPSQTFWLMPDGTALPADENIHYAIEAGGSRYAVDEAGTRLFKLGLDNSIRETIRIERPEAKHRASAVQELSVLKLTASPDGKHIIIFVGMVDGC